MAKEHCLFETMLFCFALYITLFFVHLRNIVHKEHCNWEHKQGYYFQILNNN